VADHSSGLLLRVEARPSHHDITPEGGGAQPQPQHNTHGDGPLHQLPLLHSALLARWNWVPDAPCLDALQHGG